MTYVYDIQSLSTVVGLLIVKIILWNLILPGMSLFRWIVIRQFTLLSISSSREYVDGKPTTSDLLTFLGLLVLLNKFLILDPGFLFITYNDYPSVLVEPVVFTIVFHSFNLEVDKDD